MVKLFFDSFSERVSAVEREVKAVSKELEESRASRERSQISDLVLLERLEKAETMLAESLGWIKRVANSIELPKQSGPKADEGVEVGGAKSFETYTAPVLQKFITPEGEASSLGSITTHTELQVLSMLSEQGAKSAPEIGRVIGRSREHSARLMKKLFEEGYVKRDQTRVPFRYSAVERVRASFRKPEEQKQEAREEAAPVQA